MVSRTNLLNRVTYAALLCGWMIAPAAWGQSKDSAAPPPVVTSGFVDTYFSFNFGRPTTHINEVRNFDVSENQFNVAMAEISISKAAAPVGFRIDADFGPSNDMVQSGATGSVANIGQAYVTYVAPVGAGLTVDAGKFATHMGFEVIKTKDDYNYSRSLLFALPIPYYHFGVRASYPVCPMLTLTGYAYNGFNAGPSNDDKTFGLEAALAPADGLSIIGNWIGGPPDPVNKTYRNVAEIIASYQATDKLALALDGVYGQAIFAGDVLVYKGIAGYVKYAICDPSSFTLRGEVYKDPDGYSTGVPQTIDEATVTYEYKGLSSLILRAEYRYDWSTAVVYDGSSGPLTRKNQATLAVGAIVVF